MTNAPAELNIAPEFPALVEGEVQPGLDLKPDAVLARTRIAALRV